MHEQLDQDRNLERVHDRDLPLQQANVAPEPGLDPIDIGLGGNRTSQRLGHCLRRRLGCLGSKPAFIGQGTGELQRVDDGHRSGS